MRKLRIALTKGRLEKKSVELFEKMGLDCTELINKGRKLILPVGDYEAVWPRPRTLSRMSSKAYAI